MKRTLTLLGLVLLVFLLASCVTYKDSLRGPSAQADCPPTPGVPITKDGWVFVPIGNGWYDAAGNRHHDTVYIIQGIAPGGAK